MKDTDIYKEIQEKVEKNSWIQKATYAVDNEYATTYNRSKLMFVGKGAAGKSSTIRTLLGEPFLENYKSTVLGETHVEIDVSLFNVSEWKGRKAESDQHLFESDFTNIIKQLDTNDLIQEKAKYHQMELTMPNVVAEYVNEALKLPDRSTSVQEAMELENTKAAAIDQECVTETSPEKSQLQSIARDNDELKEDKHVETPSTFSVWDFGGQEVFYTIHHLFLTANGLYVLVFNLVALLNDPDEELETINFWLDSLLLHASTAPIFIVGTRCKELIAQELSQVDELVLKATKGKKLAIIKNKTSIFFPLENSDPDASDKYLFMMKREIEAILRGDSNQTRLKGRGEEIKVAWIYYMDYITKTRKSHLYLKDAIALGNEIRLSNEEIHEALTFFTEVGTALYFNQNYSADESLDDVVILHPEWLLRAMASFLYDKHIHVEQSRMIPAELEVDKDHYHEHGLLSRDLLDFFWKKYEDKEKEFLLKLNYRMLLMSKYPFKAVDDAEDSGHCNYFLVPGMLDKFSDEIEEALPEERVQAFIRFDGPMPKGVFERIVCSFVTSSGELEGAEEPVLYSDYAVVSFQDLWVFLVCSKERKEVALIIEQEARRTMGEVTAAAKVAIEKLCRQIFAGKLKVSIILQGDKNGPVFCILQSLENALQKRKTKVKAVSATNKKKMCNADVFVEFVPNESFNKIISVARSIKATDFKYDCFLAHEWGCTSTKFQTHQRVLEVARELEANGLKPWVDGKYLRDDFVRCILQGIQRSRKIIVFVTGRYLQRCDDRNNNCSKELEMAVSRGVENIIVVAFDEAAVKEYPWSDRVVGYHLKYKLFIDLSNPNRHAENLKALIEEIRC